MAATTRGTTRYLHRVGGEGEQGVDLLGDLHRPQLRRHRGADAAGDHEPGEHRPQFPGDGKGDDRPDETGRAEPLEPGVALQREDHAGEGGGDEHDGHRPDPDLFHLLDDVADLRRRPHHPGDDLERTG